MLIIPCDCQDHDTLQQLLDFTQDKNTELEGALSGTQAQLAAVEKEKEQSKKHAQTLQDKVRKATMQHVVSQHGDLNLFGFDAYSQLHRWCPWKARLIRLAETLLMRGGSSGISKGPMRSSRMR